jgi:hypothetical protein
MIFRFLAVILFFTIISNACLFEQLSTPNDGWSNDKTHSTESNSNNESVTDGGVACEQLFDAWKKLVKNNKDCMKNSDCIIVGAGDRWCDCVNGLSDKAGDAISKSASKAAANLVQRFDSKECRYLSFKCRKTLDMIPKIPKCINGTCFAGYESCF